MLERAGDQKDLIAIHMMRQAPRRPDTALKGLRYQQDPPRAWQELIEMTARIEQRVTELEGVIAAQSPKTGIAISRGAPQPHSAQREPDSVRVALRGLSLEVLTYKLHGARVKVATDADFRAIAGRSTL